MPRGITKKVKLRTEEVARLLRRHGCITIRAVMELGFSHTQAYVALRRLVESGRAVQANVGGVALWCYSRRSAVKHINRLRKTLHALICAAKMKYVAPKDAFEVIVNDKAARRLFSRYIVLEPNNTAMWHFLGGLLDLMYGGPSLYLNTGRKPIYFVDCRRPPLPLRPLRRKKQYRSVLVKVSRRLREALEMAAEAEGVSISELARRAIERLLERYRGKPRREEMVMLSFRIPHGLLQALDVYARRMNMTQSDVVRYAVAKTLEKLKEQP
jgi:metal-responsive CopG/Arc/MetJ family transcriptional regulator